MQSITNVRHKPYECEANWEAADHAGSSEWIYTLSREDLEELNAALSHVKRTGLEIPSIQRKDFPLRNLAERLVDIRKEIEERRGFAVIRGLPVERLGESDATLMYWGIGVHLGEVLAQNMMGDLFGHVRAVEGDWNQNFNIRGYQTTVHLPFHCDKSDVVGLLCLQTAKTGGTSNIASSVAIHNEILRTHPDLLKALYGPFFIDHRGEEFEDQDPFYIAPVFTIHKDRFFSRFGQKYVESAQRFEQVPRLTDVQIEAMKMFSTLAMSDRFRLDMTFKRGDIQLLNNHLIVHSRTSYEDYPEPERRRHLLRMLMFTTGYEDVPPATRDLNAFLRRWSAEPRQSVLETL
ncbi:MAG: TauD/TfdA family dioxygenase [Pseudomonadota bacterium]|nr:TauD/TfdA family dioxygenase [Pseudomonadota bacterium]